MKPIKNSYNKNGKSLVGLILVILGCALLLRTLDLFFVPGWIFSWPAILIYIGLFIGIRSNFRRPEAYFMLFIGGLFLIDRVVPGVDTDKFFWPLIIMAFGLWIILRPERKLRGQPFLWDKRVDAEQPNEPAAGPEGAEQANGIADHIDAVSVFGGVKKNIVSKNFKGGEVVNIFGGSEINLMQADFKGTIKLEVVQFFGGTKIIIPANWTIHSEMVAIFGGIEDKRPPQITEASDKVLIIEGTSVFGGIDIRSF